MRGNMGKSLYHGFCRKEQVRHSKRAQQSSGWLVLIISLGSRCSIHPQMFCACRGDQHRGALAPESLIKLVVSVWAWKDSFNYERRILKGVVCFSWELDSPEKDSLSQVNKTSKTQKIERMINTFPWCIEPFSLTNSIPHLKF